jgi:ABC-type antimicrobial peptide transport system permease subunit
MTRFTLILQSLRFHARAHLGTLLGTAIGAAVLTGALLVGDCVRGSLREMSLARLGQTEFAATTGDRLFRPALAQEIRSGDVMCAAALALPATAANADSSARANRVQALGVEDAFWKFASQPPLFGEIPDDGVVLNTPLAQQLRAQPGDTVLLRVSRVALLPRDAPLASQDNASMALRLRVHAIATDAQLGRFGLQANQIAPFNAFVPLSRLQQAAGATNGANLLLAGRGVDAAQRLRAAWKLADAQLELRVDATNGFVELRTPRIFLDPPVVAATTHAFPSAQLIQTYFVNTLRAGVRSTPYSMVTAMAVPSMPAAMRDDEILLGQWIADDLRAAPGETIELRYFAVGTARTLEERTNRFQIRAVVPTALPWADRTLMPDFPGVARAESTRDWDASLPIQAGRIRPQDDRYWKEWRGTPKAFVTPAAGEEMWGNRFGVHTAVRFPLPEGASGSAAAATLRDQIEARLHDALDPATIGLHFEPVREQALAASRQGQDFGGLFIGFSLFLIAAALLLVSLLFQLSIEQRAREIGTLLSLGFTPAQVRRLLLAEGAALALLGALLGAVAGNGYARMLLHGLSTVWREAVGGATLRYHGTTATLALGVAISTLAAGVTLWLALRNQATAPARALLAGENMELQPAQNGMPRRSRGWITGCVAAGLALLLTGWALASGSTAAAGLFFGAGALLLLAVLAFLAASLARLAGTDAAGQITIAGLAVRNASRRRRRSLATAAMLACGSFLVVSIGAFRLDENQGAGSRAGGTGGFALLGESALPVVHDLNTPAGRDFFGLDAATVEEVSFVPLRVREGDDASCLNLNRAQRPRLLGVKPEHLARRGAFTFAKRADGVTAASPWLALKRGALPLAADEVAAMGDAASIQWALGKQIGDTIDFTDERGRPFKVRLVASLAGSVLQGSLLIEEEEFARRFPSEAGYRMFLVDAPSNRAAAVGAALTRAMSDLGLELTPTARRLAQFNAVQNTYLSTFQVLGGLGLLLGSAGLGALVLRHVLERRGELALMRAVGFRSRTLRWMVVGEHAALLAAGLAGGAGAALLAVLPALQAPGGTFPGASLAITLAAVLANGLLWTWLAAAAALRGELLEALRNQ